AKCFPYSEDEEKSIASFGDWLESMDAIISNFHDDPQVALNIGKNEVLAKQAAVLSIYGDRIDTLRPTIKAYMNPAMKLINREAYFEKQEMEFSFPNEVEYELEGKLKRAAHRFPKPTANELSSPKKIANELQAIYDDMIEVENELQGILDRYKKQNMLASEESELIARKDSILALYSKEQPLMKNQNDYHRAISSAVRGLVNEKVSAYSRLSLDEKRDTLPDIKTCFSELIALYDAQAKYPQKLKRIDEMYIRTTWNPYTFTDMDERVKERVYSAFESVLLPYFLEEQAVNLSCKNMVEKRENMDHLLNKMLDLRDQDTKEMEKALRRQGGRNEVLNIFKLNKL
ncbi:MAG: hypothetical protein WEC59_05150, partial [Salibacteraceae bacterium]